MLTLNMTRALALNPEVDLRLLVSRKYLTPDRKLSPSHPLEKIPCVGLPLSRRMREGCWLTLNRPLVDRYLPARTWVYNSGEPAYVPARRCRTIVTVHHLEPSSRWLKILRLRKSILTADLIVAQSHFTKEQVVHEYSVPPERIVVVGSGVDEIYFREDKEGRRNSTDAGPYMVTVGELLPRKGGDYLIEIGRELLRRQSSLKIMCSGGMRGVPQLVEEARSVPALILLDYLEREDLLALIRGAVCMVIPSRLEGFGLTAVEAMALGTPVIASHNSALPEILCGAGILVETGNIGRFVDEALRFQADANHRAEYVERGRCRALHFTWEACMQRLLSGIRTAEALKSCGEDGDVRDCIISHD